MSWWLLVLIVGALALGAYALFRWAAGDPAIDEEIARQQFRAQQNWRTTRRASDPTAVDDARERLENLR